MPYRETSGSGSSRDPGVTRLDAVERLRREVEQAESGERSRSADSADHPDSARPHRRPRRRKGPAPGESAGAGGLWRSDGGPVTPEIPDDTRTSGADSRRSGLSFADLDESHGESTPLEADADSATGGASVDGLREATPGQHTSAPASANRRVAGGEPGRARPSGGVESDARAPVTNLDESRHREPTVVGSQRDSMTAGAEYGVSDGMPGRVRPDRARGSGAQDSEKSPVDNPLLERARSGNEAGLGRRGSRADDATESERRSRIGDSADCSESARPDRKSQGAGSSGEIEDGGAGRARREAGDDDVVERLRRQIEQVHARGRSRGGDTAERSGSVRSQQRRSGAGSFGEIEDGDAGQVGREVRADDVVERLRRQVERVESGRRSREGDSAERSGSGRLQRKWAEEESFEGDAREGASGRAGDGDRVDARRRRSRRARSDADRFGAPPPDGEMGESGRRGRRGTRRGAEAGAQPPGGGTEAQAKDVCLRLLTDRARSRAELADKLAAKGFAADVAERALNRLAEVGLIDDAAFAEQWVHSRHTFSGKGKKVLAEELRRKGVAPEIAAPALAAITGDDERARAAELVRQKLRTLPRDLDRDKATRRLVSMLARRGYDPPTAYSVVIAELAAADLPNPPPRERPPSGAGGPDRRRPQSESDGGSEDPEVEGFSESPRSNALRRNLSRSRGATSSVDGAGSVRRPGEPSGSDSEDGDAMRSNGFGPRYGRGRPLGGGADDTDSPTVGVRRGRDCDDTAIALIRRKLRGIPTGKPQGLESRRLQDMLVRRGYTYSAAAAALDAAMAAEFPDPPEPDETRTRAADPDEPTAGEGSHVDEPTRTSDDIARTLVRRKLRATSGTLDRDKATRRLVGMLARRGYSSSQAYSIVKEELAAVED